MVQCTIFKISEVQCFKYCFYFNQSEMVTNVFHLDTFYFYFIFICIIDLPILFHCGCVWYYYGKCLIYSENIYKSNKMKHRQSQQIQYLLKYTTHENIIYFHYWYALNINMSYSLHVPIMFYQGKWVIKKIDKIKHCLQRYHKWN